MILTLITIGYNIQVSQNMECDVVLFRILIYRVQYNTIIPENEA